MSNQLLTGEDLNSQLKKAQLAYLKWINDLNNLDQNKLRIRLADAENVLAEFDPNYISEYWAKYLPVQPT